MKSKEELTALKEEAKKKPSALTDEELEQVTGGKKLEKPIPLPIVPED